MATCISAQKTTPEGDCAQERLAQCSSSLAIITDQSDLGFIANKDELEKVCPDLAGGLRCIERYTRRCMSEEQRKHFNRLYAGTTMVIQQLCRDGPYRAEFLRHAPCMRKARTDYEVCATVYQERIRELQTSMNGSSFVIAGENQLKLVCCSFQDYLQCSLKIVRQICGEETARFTKHFLDRMSSSLIKIHCEQYPVDSLVCRGPADPESASSSSSRRQPHAATHSFLSLATAPNAAEGPPTSQPKVLPVTYAAALASPTALQRRPGATNDATNEPDQTPTESASEGPPSRPAIDTAPTKPTQPNAVPDLDNTMEIDSLIVPRAAFLPERRDSLPSSDSEGCRRKQRSPKRRKRRRRTVSGQEETLQVLDDATVDQHEAPEPATADVDVMSVATSIGVPAPIPPTPHADAELIHEHITGDTTPRTIT
ncbi:uncharacterized protein LOC126298179 [Schistocerca gregaria]|uniref:uncharacterized protein LOC126298179 n=1 Tax=Schistocerca gregaria TaxID=7010 RepID=UPI00211F057C|nr:uncharacterized protein LOC126298179 [Schistocerca gregaria]